VKEEKKVKYWSILILGEFRSFRGTDVIAFREHLINVL